MNDSLKKILFDLFLILLIPFLIGFFGELLNKLFVYFGLIDQKYSFIGKEIIYCSVMIIAPIMVAWLFVIKPSLPSKKQK